MALRLRRDVQKASYYVWFLGAEEAKGLRGQRVINTVLPYLINRSRSQDSIKVTLQVSHKGIKIIQGSSKHFIPHSAITSSTQTDDIVACVLLLYNPATKCPLHVHAYRCDSETTAEALQQQLQILINRPENQKRFEELENRLGFMPQTPSSNNVNKLMNHRNHELNNEKLCEEKMAQSHNQRNNTGYPLRQHELSPKRFNSSMGSDTGNSTRESECSDENIINSPVSRSPPITTMKSLPNLQQNNELFESLAAELRAKLNGNGPPLLLPPRDYDTVHRSKGNLAAIELRRCRNALIVGSGNNTTTALSTNIPSQSASNNGKIISSRGSSGIGSDLAPSPERQELNSSSDEEPWTNEADNSVIDLKPPQLSLERPRSFIPRNSTNGKIPKHPPEENYLRDLPIKSYTPDTITHSTDNKVINEHFIKTEMEQLKSSWVRGEDEIKPIIMRPADYDVKFNRVLQSEQKAPQHYDVAHQNKDRYKYSEPRNSDRVLKKNHSLESEQLSQHIKHKSNNSLNDFDELDHQYHNTFNRNHKENVIDKQKFTQYTSPSSTEKTSAKYAVEELRKYGGKQRYVDPADLPFQQNIEHSPKHVRNTHKSGTHSPDRFANHCNDRYESQRIDGRNHFAECELRNYSRSKERNPYREPESQPYIESMEKMIKSSAIRYKSQETVGSNSTVIAAGKDDSNHSKIYQRNRTITNREETPENYNHNEYNRYKESKGKFQSIERATRYDMHENKNNSNSRSSRRGSFEPHHNSKPYNNNWSDEEPYYDSPPIEICAKSRNRDQWVEQANNNDRYRQEKDRIANGRGDTDIRNVSSRQSEPGETYDIYDINEHSKYREKNKDNSRELKRDYSSDRRSASDNIVHRPEHVIDNRKDVLYVQQDISSRNKMPNMPKGYRHSYAEPVFPRSSGRVGLAAVNPY